MESINRFNSAHNSRTKPNKVCPSTQTQDCHKTAMNPPTQAPVMLDLSKDYIVMNDEASCTSSTMSDEASWSDGSHSVEDDSMDISQVHALPGSRRNDSTRSIEDLQSGARIAPSRSTVSLSALVTNQHQSMRLALMALELHQI